jgi:hypothetical protein
MSIDFVKYMADVVRCAEEVVDEAEMEQVYDDSYVIRVPKDEWLELIEAVKQCAQKDSPVNFVDAVYWGEDFNRAEGDQ